MLAYRSDASQRDYRVVVVEDATSRLTPERLTDAVALGVHALRTETGVRHTSSRSDVRDTGPEPDVRGTSCATREPRQATDLKCSPRLQETRQDR
jgi:hypothetical protein